MPPAVIAGGIAAVGTIGGALIGSHAQSSAADQAMQAQDQASQVQLALGQQALDNQKQLGQQSLGLNQAIYNSNYDVLSPYASRGNVAGSAINALLGLPNAPAMRSPLETASGGLAPIPLPNGGGSTTGGTTPTQPAYTGPSLAQIYAMRDDGIPHNFANAMAAYNAAHNSTSTGVQTAPVVSQVPLQTNTLSPAMLRTYGARP